MATKKGGAREGAGRPIVNSEGRTETMSVTVPRGLIVDLKAYATAEGVTLSQATTEAIRALLARKKR